MSNKTVAATVKPENAPVKSEDARTGTLLVLSGIKGTQRTMKLSEINVRKGWNPRQTLPKIKELAGSIRATGIESPLWVASLKDGPAGKFIVRGHRRHAACLEIEASKDFGVFSPAKVPVFDLGTVDANTFTRLMIDHDTIGLRSDIEQGKACDMLRATGMTQAEIADRMNFSRSKVQFLLGIFRLPADMLANVEAFYRAKAEGKSADEILKDKSIPVFDQRTLQRMVTSWNAETGLGREKAEESKDFIPWKDFVSKFKEDNGRSFVAKTTVPAVRPIDQIKEMRAKFQGSGKPTSKDAVLAVLDWVLAVNGSEATVSAYLIESKG